MLYNKLCLAGSFFLSGFSINEGLRGGGVPLIIGGLIVVFMGIVVIIIGDNNCKDVEEKVEIPIESTIEKTRNF